MAIGLLILRVVVGALMIGHGTQKLFGWFGGGGITGTAGMFDRVGSGRLARRRSGRASLKRAVASCCSSAC